MARSFKTLDLFAGCGGLSEGFRKKGFKVIAANEIWDVASKTYIKNHPKTKFFLGDITNYAIKDEIINFAKDESCDVIVGGPPCQAYSVAGFRLPNDPRGKLFEDYVHMVDKVKPKIFIMENVKGLLSIETEKDNLTEEEIEEIKIIEILETKKIDLLKKRKQARNTPRFIFTKTDEKELNNIKSDIQEHKKNIKHIREKLIDKIQRRFDKIGYNTKYQVLNAADYGVPQTRERVILIGIRKEFKTEIVFPQKTHSNDQEEIKKLKLKPWITVKEAINDLKHKKEDKELSHIYMKHGDEFVSKIKNTKQGESVLKNYNNAFFRNPENEPSRTVKENHGAVFIHYEEDRTMTPRELARLQSFPDNFKFEGEKKNVLVQIGNAVPPKLSEALAKSVKAMLMKIEKENPKI